MANRVRGGETTPVIPPEKWQRAKAILLAALELPEADRSRYVSEAAVDDPVVLQLARELLAVSTHHSGDFEPPDLEQNIRDLAIGEEIANRYQIVDFLGYGGSGFVYRGVDRYTQAQVAIKFVALSEEIDLSAFEREASTLRLMELPGVIHLIEEGLHGGLPFLVTPFVEGSPFPGTEQLPVSWANMRETTLALFDILARLHASGLLHRDLKPRNVLVDRNARPWLLDLGLACTTSGFRSRDRVGTPKYLAPEILAGAPATPSSDLYSVGVMLAQALTGVDCGQESSSSFVEGANAQFSLNRRGDPDVPASVAELVTQLVQPQSSRPQSVDEALKILGEQASSRLAAALPQITHHAKIERAAQRLREGRSYRIRGPRASGKTRFAQMVAKRLKAWGVETLWLDPSRTRPTLSAIDAGLERGQGLIVDEVEEFAEDFQAALDERSGEAAILLINPKGEVEETLAPAHRQELKQLFSGHASILKTPELAVDRLLARTRGDPGLVIEELESWIRIGAAEWQPGRPIKALHDLLQRLEYSQIPKPLPILKDDSQLSLAGKRILGYLQLVSIDAAALLELTELSRGDFASTVQELQTWGLIAETDQRYRAQVRYPVLPSLNQAETRRAYRSHATRLASSGPEQLLSLIRAEAYEEVLEVSLRVARDLGHLCDSRQAARTLLESLRIHQHRSELAHSSTLLSQLVEELCYFLFRAQTRELFARALFECDHLPRAHPEMKDVRRLLEALWRVVCADVSIARSLLKKTPPFESLALEKLATVVKAFLIRGEPGREREAIVARLRSWAAEDPFIRGSLASLEGWIAYISADFGASYQKHQEAAVHFDSYPELSLRSQTNAGGAALELGDMEKTLEIARGVLADARRLGDTPDVLNALGLMRFAQAKLDSPVRADPELVELAERVAPARSIHMAVTEALIALKSKDRVLARTLAQQGVRIGNQLHANPSAALGALTLLDLLGEAVTRETYLRACRQSRPLIEYQCNAIRASIHLDEKAELTARCRELEASSKVDRSVRRELISIDDADRLLRGEIEPFPLFERSSPIN